MRKIRKSLMEIEEKDTKTVCSEMVRPFFIALKTKNPPKKWKEAGAFAPARMKKKNIKLRKTWCFLQLIIYETNVIKV